jgi:hypothetical protein
LRPEWVIDLPHRSGVDKGEMAFDQGTERFLKAALSVVLKKLPSIHSSDALYQRIHADGAKPDKYLKSRSASPSGQQQARKALRQIGPLSSWCAASVASSNGRIKATRNRRFVGTGSLTPFIARLLLLPA